MGQKQSNTQIMAQLQMPLEDNQQLKASNKELTEQVESMMSVMHGYQEKGKGKTRISKCKRLMQLDRIDVREASKIMRQKARHPHLILPVEWHAYSESRKSVSQKIMKVCKLPSGFTKPEYWVLSMC